jgi:hypothetical protein
MTIDLIDKERELEREFSSIDYLNDNFKGEKIPKRKP